MAVLVDKAPDEVGSWRREVMMAAAEAGQQEAAQRGLLLVMVLLLVLLLVLLARFRVAVRRPSDHAVHGVP